MIIGERLRAVREEKSLSQGDIEKRTGLLRCYISRVENGHTIPGVETLEKWASALKIPLYQILYEGEEPPKPLKLSGNHHGELWGNSGRQLHDHDDVATIHLRNKTGRRGAKRIQSNTDDDRIDRYHQGCTAHRSRREPGDCQPHSVEGAIEIIEEPMNRSRPPTIMLAVLMRL